MHKSLEKLIEKSEVIFWDFDGVIKDSVGVKSIAFEKLFSDFDQGLVDRVREHHKTNMGVSRYEKIPLYLSWSNNVITKNIIQEFCNRFSILVKQSVIDSPWVNGFLEFIEHHHKKKKHILVTATPIEEIEEILLSLNIRHFFYKIYGSPGSKSDAIYETLKELKTKPEHAIMLGDSESDYSAARENDVLFFLKSNEQNKNLQILCMDYQFKDFISY